MTAATMDSKLDAVDSRFSNMESKLTDKLADVDARIAKSDNEMQIAATKIVSMQEMSDNVVAKHDSLVQELNQHAGIFDPKRIKVVENAVHDLQAKLRALESQGGMPSSGYHQGSGYTKRAMENKAVTGLKTQGSVG